MLADIPWDTLLQPNRLVFILGGAIAIVAIVGYWWFRVAQARYANDLKHRLIERGMSADEIERIMAAGDEDRGHSRDKSESL